MIKLLPVFFFALCLTGMLSAPFSAAAPAVPAPLTVTLPSADSYSYWVQSKDGPVSAMPAMVTHKKSVRITAPVTTGDRVFVMDAHTGEVASHPVSIALSGAPLPIALTLSDFHPVSSPDAPAPTALPVSASKSSPDDGKPSRVAQLFTDLFSIMLAAGVGWVVLRLIQTRGEPLRVMARRLGVEVADPAAVTAEEETAAEPPAYTPEKRAPQPIPEEAGLPPGAPPAAAARLGRGPELALSDIPALHGLQGLAAGSTFSLTGGDVVIGRDGDNGIVLAENTVSRHHARLLRDSQGQFTLTDLESANGVYINGTRIQRAILSSGDEIKIGDNYFRFQAAQETL